MVLVHEFRIAMPMSVEEYRVAQLYMIAKHSNQNTAKSEGILVLKNEPYVDPVHGQGQYTEKRILLGSSLPGWVRAVIPNIFYVTEKAWNYYPFTITEYTCSFLPRFSIKIQTRYEDNRGDNAKALDGFALDKHGAPLERTVVPIDIAGDPVPEKHRHDCPDLRTFASQRTGRGPLLPGWQERASPIMCSYKLVQAAFEVWGFQTKVEAYVQRVVRDVLLVGHAQAFGWIDEWHGMSMADVRRFEAEQQAQANSKLHAAGHDAHAAGHDAHAAPVEVTLNPADADDS